MNLSDFTQPEIRHLICECNFTEEQEKLFLLRCKNKSLEECAEKVVSIMDELMSTLQEMIPKLYNGVLNRLND